jgi:hypothetical protein
MNKLKLTECKICGQTKSPRGFSFHISQTHNISVEDYILKYEFNGVHPTCKCGCGSPVTIRRYDVMDYVDGHCSIGHFKPGVNPRKNIELWKENVTAGIRRYNAIAKIKNPEYRSGINNNFYGRTHSDETVSKIREKVEEQIRAGKHSFIGNINGRIGKSSLEVKFENYLISNGIDYIHNYKVAFVPEGKTSVRYKYYDFYIPLINTVVEIHGSYWHPTKKENLTEMQLGNLKNDIFKKSLAKKQHYDILTIYDYELDKFIDENILESIIDESKICSIDITLSGYLKGNGVIELPEYWTELVDADTITVNLTAIGKHQKLYVADIKDNCVYVKNDSLFGAEINCFYTVYGERKDIDKMNVES